MPHSSFNALSATLLTACCLAAQISSPSSGFVRYDHLPVQRLLGVGGSLIPSATAFGAAEAASFSSSGGLLATNGLVELIRPDGSIAAQFPYHGAPPLLNVDRGLASAIAWLPDARVLLYWNSHDFVSLTLAEGLFEGVITAISLASPDTARFLVTNPDSTVSAILVSLANGNLISSNVLPGVEGPAYQFGSHLLWLTREGLQIEEPGSRARILPLPLPRFTAEQMSTGWIHLFSQTNQTHYALCLTAAEPALWQIPAPHDYETGRERTK